MKPNKINRSLIKSVVQKAIEHIQKNPEREIRNLIDMGSLFAKGAFQKQFFHTAEKELEKDDSPYYKITAELIQKTDKDNLLTFGMNLGYNSLTYGAAAIREFEEQSGYNVPWALLIEVSERGKLDVELLGQLISQGEELGIASYALILDSGYTKMDALAEVIEKHHDCAFMLLIEPDMDLPDIKTLQRLKNILIGVDISFNDSEKTREITRRLRDAKLLCTAFYRPEAADRLETEHAARLAASLGYELVFTLHEYAFFVDHHEEIEKAVNEMRLHIQAPVISFDLMVDVVMVDRMISSEGCLAVVSADGDLRITNMETKEQSKEYHIMACSLKDIFHRTLVKRQTHHAT